MSCEHSDVVLYLSMTWGKRYRTIIHNILNEEHEGILQTRVGKLWADVYKINAYAVIDGQEDASVTGKRCSRLFLKGPFQL